METIDYKLATSFILCLIIIIKTIWILAVSSVYEEQYQNLKTTHDELFKITKDKDPEQDPLAPRKPELKVSLSYGLIFFIISCLIYFLSGFLWIICSIIVTLLIVNYGLLFSAYYAEHIERFCEKIQTLLSEIQELNKQKL